MSLSNLHYERRTAFLQQASFNEGYDLFRQRGHARPLPSTWGIAVSIYKASTALSDWSVELFHCVLSAVSSAGIVSVRERPQKSLMTARGAARKRMVGSHNISFSVVREIGNNESAGIKVSHLYCDP